MIAINDMQMPSSCYECNMYWVSDWGWAYCRASKSITFIRTCDTYTYLEYKKRHDECPLTDLPDGLYQVQGDKIWKYHGKGEK